MPSIAFTSDQLTESQRKAVYHIDGPMLVLAGPGSGKTRVITSRIANLIENGVKPWNICAITFTNKAAEEMRARLTAGNCPSGVNASTFHSLCVRILRQYSVQAGLKDNFTIYDTDDQRRCMKQCIKDCDFDSTNFTPAKMLERISNYKNDLESPDAVQGRAEDYYTQVSAKIYKHYQVLLANNNAMDFDDLLFKTAMLIRDNEEVRNELSNRYRYLLVDEYQDTNHAQYQIAKGMALAHGNICVTGDPDQSIYRWRGADIANILAFEKDWPSALVVKLEENFRSTPNILEMADKLISNNTQRKEKRLIATLPKGTDAEITRTADEAEESQTVADGIKALMRKGVNLNEVAIFYRVNSMSRSIEEGLVKRQIPYQVVRGVEFYARKEIRDIISYLKLVSNPDDDIALLRAVATHSRGIGKTSLDKLARHANVKNQTLYAAMRRADQITTIGKATQTKMAAFAVMIEKFCKNIDGKVSDLMKDIFEETGLGDVMRAAGEKQESALENISELINSAAKYDEQDENPNLLDYLQSIALYSDTDAYQAESSKVSLMTLHAAKGLEFDYVFIVGLEDGLLPHERSLGGDNEELEEERRLFFVGITRARKELQITYAKHRVMRGQFLRTTPSQFLSEVGYSYNEFDVDFGADKFNASFTPKPKAPKKDAAYVPGQLVRHKKFGLGRVKEFLDLGDNSVIVVSFNSGTTKSLMMAYAKLEKIQ
jgi:DNA helicase-2/ATP-dependent DNA helicase PcrA